MQPYAYKIQYTVYSRNSLSSKSGLSKMYIKVNSTFKLFDTIQTLLLYNGDSFYHSEMCSVDAATHKCETACHTE